MDFIKILSNAVLWLISQARAIVEWMNKKPKPSDGQNNSPPPESPSKGSSDAQNLYIGHIDKLTGLINGTDPINLQGEVVFYGYNKDTEVTA